MKKKFLFLLSTSIFVLVLAGSLIFSVVIKKFVANEISNQIIEDNQKIGIGLINFLSSQVNTTDVSEMVSSLQGICDTLELPNGGFICVMNEHGELLAAPGLPPGHNPSMQIMSFESLEGTSLDENNGLRSKQVLSGILNYENGAKTDIIASLPLGSSMLRLNVHQDLKAALDRTDRFFKGIFPLAILVALSIAFVGYLLLNSIVRSYESKIETQAEIIRQKNNDLTSSLRYASSLQSSYLPDPEAFNSLFKESFILLKPKDIVSGDFFYMKETKNKKYFSVIDCTGHGVPGALISMIGYGLLEQSIQEYGEPNAAQILHFLCKKFPEALAGNKNLSSTDGMDMAICAMDKNTNDISFSGSRNPLYLVRNGELLKYPGEKISIGQHVENEGKCFSESIVKPEAGDMLYMSSDGYMDQFGGPDGKKFMARRFRELLLKAATFSAKEQLQLFEDSLEKWKGHYLQVDDITVMGIRIR